MCAVDWTALGTWASAIAILFAGIVALVQLNRFIASEHLKSTLRTFESFHALTHTSLLSISPSQALGELAEVGRHQDIVDLYNSGMPIIDAAAQQKTRVAVYIQVICNYFSAIPDLIKSHKLDNAFFFSQMKLAIDMASQEVPKFTYVPDVDYGALTELASLAADRKKRPSASQRRAQ